MRKLGELGCSGPEARNRLKRLLDKGLRDSIRDETIPLTVDNRKFLSDMVNAVADNPNFEPSYGQVVYAQDLFDRYLL